jgi:DNA-binding NarL/FixJ family response regulator
MKILVVDDHALVREGLRQVLKGLDENVEVLQAGNCSQAFAFAQAHADLDLVLLDYHLPDGSGLDALRYLGQHHPELPVLVLSASESPPLVQQILEAGAAGFVAKSGLSEELLDAVRKVLNGDIFVAHDWARTSDPRYAATLADKPPLTHRQTLVLSGLLDGHSNREISRLLNVSEETVKTHVAAILRHFEVQNRTQAVMAAARSGYKSQSGA